jgi:hypothetical protein
MSLLIRLYEEGFNPFNPFIASMIPQTVAHHLKIGEHIQHLLSVSLDKYKNTYDVHGIKGSVNFRSLMKNEKSNINELSKSLVKEVITVLESFIYDTIKLKPKLIYFMQESSYINASKNNISLVFDITFVPAYETTLIFRLNEFQDFRISKPLPYNMFDDVFGKYILDLRSKGKI